MRRNFPFFRNGYGIRGITCPQYSWHHLTRSHHYVLCQIGINQLRKNKHNMFFFSPEIHLPWLPNPSPHLTPVSSSWKRKFQRIASTWHKMREAYTIINLYTDITITSGLYSSCTTSSFSRQESPQVLVHNNWMKATLSGLWYIIHFVPLAVHLSNTDCSLELSLSLQCLLQDTLFIKLVTFTYSTEPNGALYNNVLHVSVWLALVVSSRHSTGCLSLGTMKDMT